MMHADRKSRSTRLVAFALIAIALVGYFTGIQAPMPARHSSVPWSLEDGKAESESMPAGGEGVIPATAYAKMAEVTRRSRRRPEVSLASFRASLAVKSDPLAEIAITPADKQQSLDRRQRNRAFNGAPPTTPHPIDQRSDASCVACHVEGARAASFRIPRMSHRLLTNCAQCHVESNARHLPVTPFGENSFAGLAAPEQGPRAFSGAPPIIPHSTWMRSDCMSCHGYVGEFGIRTTHPWRTNCQQCHAPSAALDQTLLISAPKFLPGPKIIE